MYAVRYLGVTTREGHVVITMSEGNIRNDRAHLYQLEHKFRDEDDLEKFIERLYKAAEKTN